MNTNPTEFKNQIYMVAYGVEGLIDHVDSEVYDAHQAFEIDKTKMKMLVPLDMNNQNILNYELKFGNLFKLIKCYAKPLRSSSSNPLSPSAVLVKKSDNQNVSFSMGFVIHAFTLYTRQVFSQASIQITTTNRLNRFISIPKLLSTNDSFCNDISTICVFENGIRNISFHNTERTQFDVDLVISYI